MYLSLLDLKEKCTRYMYVGVSTKETVLFHRHDHHTGQNKVEYYRKYLQSLALFVEQTQMVKRDEDSAKSGIHVSQDVTHQFSGVTSSWSTN